MCDTPEAAFRESIYSRTYCRVLKPDDAAPRKESRYESISRVLQAFEKYYPAIAADKKLYDESEWFSLISKGVALPAGRMLWTMGAGVIEKEGFLSMMNCSFIKLDHPVQPLGFILKMLILGCGVGFSVERKYFRDLQTIFSHIRWTNRDSGVKASYEKMNDEYPFLYKPEERFYVEDSKEGWASFLLNSVTRAIARQPVFYSLSNLRPAGSLINGFGGRSGDPEKLGEIVGKIYWMVAESTAASVELYYDIVCLIAELVVSGNVRRSALICIGDPDDKAYLALKQFKTMGRGTSHRSFCNNSVNVQSFEQLGEDFWATYNGTSEPYGWVNTEKCIIPYDGKTRYQPVGFNPCGEQPLANREVCCLSEINLVRVINDMDLFKKAAKMCYLFCKMAYTLGAPTEPETNKICQANQRIGISLTGISMVKDDGHLWNKLMFIKDYLRDLDRAVSKRLGVNTSVALTTVKPGGTLPKIAGSSGPGIHRPISAYQIRRVRFARDCALLPWFKQMRIPIEPQFGVDGQPVKDGTQVVSFYLKNDIPADGHFSDWQLTPEGLNDMFEKIATTQATWSDNSISVTVYYKLEDVDLVLKPMMHDYFESLKCFSGLPYYGHNFLQAPEEPISEGRYYDYLLNTFRPTDADLPLDLDGATTPEDFGQCESVGSCTDR